MIALAVGWACEPAGHDADQAEIALSIEWSRDSAAGEPWLFVDGTGLLSMSWHESRNDSAFLMLAERRADGWTEPTTVVANRPFFVNWADIPGITVLNDGTRFVHWLEKVPGSPYAYHIMLTRSGDGGATWSEPRRLHEDTAAAEHGFLSTVATSGGELGVVWLDGRSAGGDVAGQGTNVVWTTMPSNGGGGWNQQVINPRVCDCCQTAVVETPSGLVAAFRDRTDDEIRDIGVSRLVNGVWTEPTYLGPDGWQIHACPVNGPALSARGDTVSVAWFTGVNQEPAVWFARSTDGGATFGPRVRMNDTRTLGRLAVADVEGGATLVVWMAQHSSGTSIDGRLVAADGTLGPTRVIVPTSEARSSGFPKVAFIENEIVLAWTVVDEGMQAGIRVASIAQSDFE